MSFISQQGVITPPLTAGGVAYGNGSNAFMTGAGTAGQVLTSAGADAPVWGAGGGLNLLSTITANNSATVDFENISSTYDTYIVVGNTIRSQFSNQTNLRARPKLNGSFTPSATARYNFCGTGLTNGVTPTTISGNLEGSDTFVQMTAASVVAGQQTAEGTSFTLILYGPMNTADLVKQGTFQSVSRAADTNSASFMNGSMTFGTSNFVCGPMTGIRFYLNSGNMVTGVFRIYGLAK
jgi:hypothetical protein